MWDRSFVRTCALVCVVLLAVLTTESAGFVLPSQEEVDPIGQTRQEKYSLPELSSVSSLPPQVTGFPVTFQNGTSLLRLAMQSKAKHERVKRETSCKDRPTIEVMQYEDLKLPNRCWTDCDCRVGRFCTKHSWCHDMSKP